MSLNTIYVCSTLLALGGWAYLIGSIFFTTTIPRFTAWIVPVVLAMTYAVLMVGALPFEGGSFSSIGGLVMLFSQQENALAGWVHYLAVDLFIGGWELQTARRQQMPNLIIALSLALTMLLAPVGLLFFLVALQFSKKKAGNEF